MGFSTGSFVTYFMLFSWGSPIGLGFLLACLGVYYWGKSFNKKEK